MDFRRTLLAAGLAVLVAAAPVAACLATVSESPVAERAHTGCHSIPDAPSQALCPGSGSVIPADGPAGPVSIAAGLDGVSHPCGACIQNLPEEEPAPPAPRARSAPIHLLHATFLI